MACLWPAHGLLMARSWPAHGQLMASGASRVPAIDGRAGGGWMLGAILLLRLIIGCLDRCHGARPRCAEVRSDSRARQRTWSTSTEQWTHAAATAPIRVCLVAAVEKFVFKPRDQAEVRSALAFSHTGTAPLGQKAVICRSFDAQTCLLSQQSPSTPPACRSLAAATPGGTNQLFSIAQRRTRRSTGRG